MGIFSLFWFTVQSWSSKQKVLSIPWAATMEVGHPQSYPTLPTPPLPNQLRSNRICPQTLERLLREGTEGMFFWSEPSKVWAPGEEFPLTDQGCFPEGEPGAWCFTQPAGLSSVPARRGAGKGSSGAAWGQGLRRNQTGDASTETVLCLFWRGPLNSLCQQGCGVLRRWCQSPLNHSFSKSERQ